MRLPSIFRLSSITATSANWLAGLKSRLSPLRLRLPWMASATSYNFNLGIQRVLPLHTLLDVSYVGTIANHLIGDVQYNAPSLRECMASAEPEFHVGDNCQYDSGRQCVTDEFLSSLPRVRWIGRSDQYRRSGHDGCTRVQLELQLVAQISVQRRAGRRSTFGANYTWSKALGTISGDFQAVNPFNTRVANYGPLSFDRRQFFNIDYTYNIPDGARGFLNNIVGKELLNGWQLSGITGFSAGAPLTAGYGYLNVSSAVLNQEITGSPYIAPRGQLICNPTTTGPHTIQQYINTSCIVPANKGEHRSRFRCGGLPRLRPSKLGCIADEEIFPGPR